MGKKLRILVWCLFVLYAATLLLLLLHRAPMAEYHYNLRPLKTIGDYIKVLRRSDPEGLIFRPYALKNFLGNILVFIPLGVFLPLLFRRQRRFLLFLLTVTAAVCLVELIQYFTQLGSLDIDDLILNLPGACLGWLLWRLCLKEKKEEKNRGSA